MRYLLAHSIPKQLQLTGVGVGPRINMKNSRPLPLGSRLCGQETQDVDVCYCYLLTTVMLNCYVTVKLLLSYC